MPETFAGLLIAVRSKATVPCIFKDRAMNKFDFTLILGESLELTDDLADTLFAAGCDDGAPGTCNGVFSIISTVKLRRLKKPCAHPSRMSEMR
jgi:hypothetical protein